MLPLATVRKSELKSPDQEDGMRFLTRRELFSVVVATAALILNRSRSDAITPPGGSIVVIDGWILLESDLSSHLT